MVARKQKEITMNECPICGAIWTIEENDWQQCACCGYPNNEEDFDD